MNRKQTKAQSPCQHCANYLDYNGTEYGKRRCEVCNTPDNQRLVETVRNLAKHVVD